MRIHTDPPYAPLRALLPSKIFQERWIGRAYRLTWAFCLARIWYQEWPWRLELRTWGVYYEERKMTLSIESVMYNNGFCILQQEEMVDRQKSALGPLRCFKFTREYLPRCFKFTRECLPRCFKFTREYLPRCFKFTREYLPMHCCLLECVTWLCGII